MAKDQSWIADLLAGYTDVQVGGVAVPRRKILNLLSGTAVDNPTAQTTDVSMSGFNGGWVTALDLDLTTQPNQNFFTDTTYTYAGMTWTKFRSSGDAITSQINGTGLVLNPVSTGTASRPTAGAPDAYPQLWLPLSQIAALANVAPDWPLRFSCVCSITDVTQSAAAMMLSPLANATEPYFYAAKNPTTTANTFEVVVSGSATSVTVAFINATEFTNDNAVVMSMPGGLSRAAADLLIGDYSSGWPANSSLLPAGSNGTTGTLFNSTNPSRIASWGIGLGGWHNGAGSTAPTVVFQRLRVEYIVR